MSTAGSTPGSDRHTLAADIDMVKKQVQDIIDQANNILEGTWKGDPLPARKCYASITPGKNLLKDLMRRIIAEYTRSQDINYRVNQYEAVRNRLKERKERLHDFLMLHDFFPALKGKNFFDADCGLPDHRTWRLPPLPSRPDHAELVFVLAFRGLEEKGSDKLLPHSKTLRR